MVSVRWGAPQSADDGVLSSKKKATDGLFYIRPHLHATPEANKSPMRGYCLGKPDVLTLGITEDVPSLTAYLRAAL